MNRRSSLWITSLPCTRKREGDAATVDIKAAKLLYSVVLTRRRALPWATRRALLFMGWFREPGVMVTSIDEDNTWFNGKTDSDAIEAGKQVEANTAHDATST